VTVDRSYLTLGTSQHVDAAEDALKLHTAFSEGQRAGHLGVRINPFLDGTAEHAEWRRGRETTMEEAA
jgi:hypothetical protein